MGIKSVGVFDAAAILKTNGVVFFTGMEAYSGSIIDRLRYQFKLYETATQKIKRNVLMEQFSELIEEMYS